MESISGALDTTNPGTCLCLPQIQVHLQFKDLGKTQMEVKVLKVNCQRFKSADQRWKQDHFYHSTHLIFENLKWKFVLKSSLPGDQCRFLLGTWKDRYSVGWPDICLKRHRSFNYKIQEAYLSFDVARGSLNSAPTKIGSWYHHLFVRNHGSFVIRCEILLNHLLVSPSWTFKKKCGFPFGQVGWSFTSDDRDHWRTQAI